MVDIVRPAYGEAWASVGEKVSPTLTKIQGGWIQEMMPYQWENFLQNRQDTALLYMLQKGVPEWDASQEYIAGKSVVTYQTNLYISVLDSTNVLPTVQSSWKKLNPSTSASGVVTIAGGGTGADTAAAARTNLGLGSIATATAPTSNGVVVRSAANTLISRSIAGTANNIVVTNGDGVAGNISINAGSNVALLNTDSSWTSTGSIRLPSGSTSQQGASAPGRVRFNLETDEFHGAYSDGWKVLARPASAEQTPITDVGNFYTSSNVEGALQEVGLKASFVKDAILSYPDYAAASAAAATLPDGQEVISQNSSGAPHKYKVIAGGLQDLGLIGASVFLDNESDFSTTKVAANQNTIFIYGKDAAHDGGHSVYKRVASEPVNAPKAQTEDGAWWERVADNDPIGLVLAVGSSTYEGFGAGDDGAFSPHGPPSKANGWTSHPDSVMGLLGAYVSSKGGRLLNISIGGKNSSWFIDRFWEDIAPWNPRTVLFGTGWANEPGANAWQKARSYTRNLARLRGLCDKIGASLIVGSFNPVSNGNTTTNRGQWEVKRWCATNGIRCWDFSASFPEGESFLPADLRVDDIHMNKSGCAVAYEAIVKSDLEVERMHGPLSPFPVSENSIRVAYTGSEREAPAYFYVDNDDHCPLGWAIQFKFIADNIGANLCTVMTLDARDGTSARIRYIDKSIRFTTGASTDHFSIPFDPEDYPGSVRLFVSYDHRIDNVIARINSSDTIAGTANISLPYLKRIRFLGNAAGSFGTAAGWEFISAIVWGASARADGHVTGLYASDFPIHASMLAATAMDNCGNFGIPNALRGLYSFAVTDSGARVVSRLGAFDIYCSSGALTLSTEWARLPLNLKTFSISGVDVLRNNEIYLPEGRYSISAHVRANATTVPFTGGMRVYLKRPGVSSAVIARSTCEVGVTGTHQNKMAAEFPLVIDAGGARLYVEVNAPTGAGSINQDDTNTFVRISRTTYESIV